MIWITNPQSKLIVTWNPTSIFLGSTKVSCKILFQVPQWLLVLINFFPCYAFLFTLKYENLWMHPIMSCIINFLFWMLFIESRMLTEQIFFKASSIFWRSLIFLFHDHNHDSWNDNFISFSKKKYLQSPIWEFRYYGEFWKKNRSFWISLKKFLVITTEINLITSL